MKNTGLWIRTAIIIVITLVGAYIVFGPRNSFTAEDFSWSGIKKNLAQNINLGLDLKGGSYLEMRVKTDEYLQTVTKTNKDAALTAAKDAQLPVGEATYVAANKVYQVSLNVTDATKIPEVIEAVKKKVDFVNAGGTGWSESTNGNTITWSLPVQAQKILSQQAVDQVLKIIDSRINSFGVKEPTLQKKGSADSGQILLQMPGLENPERVKDLIGKQSKLEMLEVVSPPSPSAMMTYATKESALQTIGGKETDDLRVLPFTERDDTPLANKDPQVKPPSKFVVVKYPAIVDGGELRDASATAQSQNSNSYQINFAFKPNGAQKFGKWTGENINKYMAVVLNEEVKSAAFIKSQIFDQGQIDGRFTKDSASDLVLTLKSGALPAQIVYQEERTVGLHLT